jgi:hypothetical protein
MSLGSLVSSLLDDGRKFAYFAREASRDKNEALMNTYCRAVVFSVWSALEGWINYISSSFAEIDTTLSQYEIAFLKERKIQVNEDGLIEISNQDDYKPTTTRLLFILQKYGGRYDLKHENPDLWRRLREAEKTRHSLVHPKRVDEDMSLDLKNAEEFLETINEVIQMLRRKIYK